MQYQIQSQRDWRMNIFQLLLTITTTKFSTLTPPAQEV